MTQVRRDFDAVYATEDDPWAIGAADSERYERYRALVLQAVGERGAILDIGSGFGAFLARFEGEFKSLHAIELSASAVRRGRERFPFIDFEEGTAEALDKTRAEHSRFDAILLSDVLYYLDEDARRRALAWIGAHLTADGIAFVAGWCPGGDYLTPEETRRLVAQALVIEDERVLESGHAVFRCRRKRLLAALTLDYETWQPIPDGRRIDWEQDVFGPTAALLDALDGTGARMTIFAECGEWFWLRENEPALAERWEQQLRDARLHGHDVQLHLHPQWLPELGARRDGDRWIWNHELARAADYPGDLELLIARCKRLIEETLEPVDPGYRVTCFRAGAYEAQPFARLYDALASNGLRCDSSVYPGARHPERGYDYTLAYSQHQPYFASRSDPQLKAPPAERALVELPVMAFGPNDRWTFDASEGNRFARRLLEWRLRQVAEAPTTERLRRRRAWGIRIGNLYARFHSMRGLLNRILPRRLAWLMTGYQAEALAQHEYYVLVGHSKTDLDPEAVGRGARELIDAGFELVPLSEMADLARREIDAKIAADPVAEAEWQVQREYGAMMSDERNEAQSFRLQELVPYDRDRILDFGCGSGVWSARLAELRPWATVTGIDIGEDFIAKARARFGSDGVTFEVADFTATGFGDGQFDCVYADNSLEHAFDVDATLREVHRVLRDGGLLCAAIPPDARNPGRVCDNHTWKTAPQDVRMRLSSVGFSDIYIDEVDVFRRLGMPPFPPSLDRMMYIVGWKRSTPTTQWTRAEEIATWAYRRLDPERTQESDDAVEILRGGYAWCAGYNVVTGTILERAGYDITWVSMIAEGHPRGRGDAMTDSHEILEVRAPNGEIRVLDPMANVWYPQSLSELLRHPELADFDRVRDERYQARGYDLYATSQWFRLVKRVSMRPAVRARITYKPVESLR